MNLNTLNKYINLLTEDIDPLDQSYTSKTRQRVVDVARTAKVAKEAAKKAREKGQNTLANQLDEKAKELEEVANKWNEDVLDSEGGNQNSVGGNAEGETTKPQMPPMPQQPKKGGQGEETKPGQDSKGNEDGEGKNADQPGNEPGNDEGDPGKQGKQGDPGKQGKQGKQGDPGDEGDPGDSGDPGDEGDPGDSGDPGDEGDPGDFKQSKKSKDDKAGKKSGDTGNQENKENNGEGDGGEGEETEDEKNKPSKRNIKDIFGMSSQEELADILNGKNIENQQPEDPTIEDIKKMLGSLKGEARRGAKDGLSSLINDIKDNAIPPVDESLNIKKLNEGKIFKKGLRELSDDEFADGINDVLDLIDKVAKLDYVDPKEKVDKLNKIKKLPQDKQAIRDLQKETNVEIAKGFKKVKARKGENEKYKQYKTISQFKINFGNAIHDQVEIYKQTLQSYSAIDPFYYGSGVISKGEITREEEEKNKPIINFYFDVSGSWTSHPDAVEIGKEAVATIKHYEDEGLVKLNIYYFGHNSISNDMMAVWGGGTWCWEQILDNIVATGAKNVVLMTDGDMASEAHGLARTAVVDGNVWFIWSLYDYKEGSVEIMKHLRGRGMNNQYSFGSGGQYAVDYNPDSNDD